MTVWSDSDVLGMAWRFRARQQSAAQVALTFGTSRNSVIGIVTRIAKAEPAAGELADDALLSIMHDFEARGLAAADIAARLGVPRDVVLAAVHAVRLDYSRSRHGEAALRPENADGGMPRVWWGPGLIQRGAAA